MVDVLWKCTRLLFHMKCRSSTSSVYLILFSVRFLCLRFAMNQWSGCFPIIFKYRWKIQAYLSIEQKNFALFDWMCDCVCLCVHLTSKAHGTANAVFIGLLIYAELKARDVVFKIDPYFSLSRYDFIKWIICWAEEHQSWIIRRRNGNNDANNYYLRLKNTNTHSISIDYYYYWTSSHKTHNIWNIETLDLIGYLLKADP